MCLILLLAIVFCSGNMVHSAAVTGSTRTIVQEGDQVELPCTRTDDGDSVQWRHYYDERGSFLDVYKHGKLLNEYAQNGRYLVDDHGNLLIRNVQWSDSGRFVCSSSSGGKLKEHAIEVIPQETQPLLIPPSNTLITASHTARLTCTTKSPQGVWWKHKPLAAPEDREVYMLGEFQNGYKRSGRFHIDVDEGSGKYDLLINDAQSSDAGTYTCIDEEGLGARGDAELVVLDSPASCDVSDEDLNIDICGKDPSSVQFSCSISWTGNIRPALRIKNMDGQTVATSHALTITGHGSTTSLVWSPSTSASKLSKLTCEASIDTRQHQPTTRISAVSHVNKCSFNYEPVHTTHLTNWTSPYRTHHRERLTCRVETNASCTYSWINPVDQRVIHDNRVLHLKEHGQYMCKAVCRIHGTSCTVYPMFVEFSELSDNLDADIGTRGGRLFVIPLAILGSIVAILVTILLFVCFRFLRSKHAQRTICDNRGELQSVSIGGKYLYILSKINKQIFVYTIKEPFVYIRSLPIDFIQSPEDIEYCETFNRLYISDSNESCIWEMAPDNNSEPKQLVTNISFPFTLSTSHNHIVMVSSQRTENGMQNELQLINKRDGHREPPIRVQEDQESLQQAIPNQNCFIVNFGKWIGKADKRGNILCRYPGSTEPSLAQWCLCVADVVSKYVYVLNAETEEILVLDGHFNLQTNRPGVRLNGLRNSLTKVYYDESQKVIFAASESGILVTHHPKKIRFA